MELKDRLKQSRKNAKLTQNEVIERIDGLTQSAYSQLENGKVKSSGKIVELANLFGVNSTWLATGQGEMTINSGTATHYDNVQPAKAKKTAPLINWVKAGKFTEVADDTYEEYLPYFGDYGDDTVYWLRIIGNSMTPDFKQGEFVLINKDRQPVAGNYVVALEHNKDTATFKKYRPKGFDHNGKEYWHLVPSNEEYPIIDSRYQPFDVIGVAVERNQKLI